MIVAWSVDRLGRSLQDLVGFLTELQVARLKVTRFAKYPASDKTVLVGTAHHPANQVADLLPWNWKANQQSRAAVAAWSQNAS
jgi:hypothetical protein